MGNPNYEAKANLSVTLYSEASQEWRSPEPLREVAMY